MDWHESVSEGFPRRNRDEPPSLRRDIADELGDHLACAFARELERAGDESAARRGVLDRFGDPKKLARRLWLDAMREVIMNQRLLLATCIILAAACLATATFSWISMTQSRQANQALLTKLEDMSQQTQAASTWSHLEVDVRRGTEDGPPVEGLRVSLKGKPYGEEEETLELKVNSEGRCRFGPVRPGRYRVTVRRDSEYVRKVSASSPSEDPLSVTAGSAGVILYPGEEERKTITYPEIPHARIRFAIDLPPDLKEKGLLFGCGFKVLPFYGGRRFGTWEPAQRNHHVDFDSDGELYRRLSTSGTISVFEKSRPVEQVDSWLALDVSLEDIEVYRRIEAGPTTGTYERVAGIGMQFKMFEPGRGYSAALVAFADASWRRYPLSERANVENVWTIELPEAVIQDIRLHLQRLVRPEEKITGRLVETVPIESCATLLTSKDQTWVDRKAQLNNADNGSHFIVKWKDIPAAEVSRQDRRFVLALFSRETTVDDRPPGRILGHEVAGPWPGESGGGLLRSARCMPRPFGHFDFEPDAGWKLLDVTPLVRAQARDSRPNHGALFRFEGKELVVTNQKGRPGDGESAVEMRVIYRPQTAPSLLAPHAAGKSWSGYKFILDPRSAEWMDSRPVLLVVEPKP